MTIAILTCVFVYLAPQALGHEVYESAEDTEPPNFSPNITTLYPVPNKTEEAKSDLNVNQTQPMKTTKSETDATAWKIDTAYAKSNLSEDYKGIKNDKNVASIVEFKKSSDDFRPSIHLGSIEEDVLPAVTTTVQPVLQVIKKPTSTFKSSPKDKYKSHSIPKDVRWSRDKFPYKIESTMLTRTENEWQPSPALDLVLPEELSLRVPAGGLYKLPVTFEDKPITNSADKEYGLEVTGHINENIVKKRPRPWKHLLHLATALVPAGLIISALTPRVVTIRGTASDHRSRIN